MARIPDLVRLFRPKHWVKNVFVLMPVPFAVASGARPAPWAFVLGVLALCLANSAVYAFNDAQDADQDRRHPRKRERPVASGRVGRLEARVWSVLLLAAGIALASLTGHVKATTIVFIYALLNVFYSLGAKNVPLLDVFVISSGFVLRVLLGCALISVHPSSWLLLCSSALALFLGLAKRRADLAKGTSAEHRPSLAGYSVTYLDHAMTASAALTIIAYALYSMESEVLVRGREFAGLPFVVFGVFDYLRATHVSDRADFPVDLVLRSPVILACGVGWCASTMWSIGLV